MRGKMKTAVVYNANLKEAAQTADWLEAHGYEVLRKNAVEEIAELGRTSERAVELLVVQIDTAYDGEDGPVGTPHDYDAMAAFVAERIYEAGEVVEQCLPALEKGRMKRIAFLTRSSGSIRECTDRDHFAEHMILAGVHMRAKLLYNRLRRDGYTMRLYAADDGEVLPGQISAGAYVDMNFCYDAEEPYIHSEENRFVMRDKTFRELSW